MALSSVLTSTIILRGYERAITGASKNKAAIADPVILDILSRDRALGGYIGRLINRTSLLDLGGSKATAKAEGAAQASATAITPSNVEPTPARYEFARDLLDSERSRLRGLGMDGDLPPAVLDAIVVESVDTWANTFIDGVCDEATSATYQIGTTLTALTWKALYEGYYDLINRGAGQLGAMATVKVKGVKDLAEDALSLGGAVSMAGQVQQFLNVGGSGYVGTFFGGLRLYMLDDVATSGSDDVGLLLTPKGIRSAHEIVPLPAELGSNILLQAGGDMGWITVEAKRAEATSANSRLETAFRFGIAENDAKGYAKIVYKTT